LKENRNAIAETIENNVRRKIIKEHLQDPAFYEKMSALLDEIIAARKAKAIEYEEYLRRIAEVAKRVGASHSEDMPEEVDTPGRRALYNNLNGTFLGASMIGGSSAGTGLEGELGRQPSIVSRFPVSSVSKLRCPLRRW